MPRYVAGMTKGEVFGAMVLVASVFVTVGIVALVGFLYSAYQFLMFVLEMAARG